MTTGIAILWPTGELSVLAGDLLWVLGAAGRDLGGRRHDDKEDHEAVRVA